MASPVGEDYREIAKNLTDPGGRINANIRLSLPLENDDLQEEVKVILNFDNAAINAPNWGMQLSSINGNAHVTNETISASGIKALYFNDPVSIDIATDQQTRATLVKANGLIETAQMVNLLPAGLTEGLDGRSEWQVNLAIANETRSGNESILTIDATSGLQGTKVLLPEPFSKSAQVRRRTSSKINIRANDEIDFHVYYGTHIQTRGRLEKAGDSGFQLADLDIGLATSLSEKPQGGIRLHGSIPKLPLDEWIAVYRVEAARQKPGSRSLLPLLQTVDLNVSHVTVFDRSIKNADFLLTQSPNGF